MRMCLGKYYYGAWQNFYHLNWPMRFFIEWVLGLGILCGILKLFFYLIKKWKLEEYLVKAWCVIVKETAYVLGREKEWAIAIDNKMVDWAKEKTGKSKSKKRRKGSRKMFFFAAVILYLLAVFVDLPFSAHISEEYLGGMGAVKVFFQRMESYFSEGYEQYPPLFVRVEVEEPAVTEAAEEIPVEKEPIYIQLNERGKSGANIRSEADLNNKGNIIGGVNENSEILYLDEWVYDGKRYWLRVYVPDDDLEGWLSGQLVDSDQLKGIVGENTNEL